MDLIELLKLAIEKKASDLHLTEDAPPILRVDGALKSTRMDKLTREDTKRMIYSIMDSRQRDEFEKLLDYDFSIDVSGVGRCRVNVHMQRGSVEAAFRIVPQQVQTIEELSLPSIVGDFARLSDGLILITGPTGVGKTTTLAAMVDLINDERQMLVVTIEDPIEYVHVNKKSIIKQREIHSDTLSFADALKHVLRQDPNVIVVGEMRDLETIQTALTAAETGHLVLATLHTSSATGTIDRIIDVFPPYQQEQIRVQLASSLQGVVTQQLLPKAKGTGRMVCCEIMVATPAVKHLIREGETEQIQSIIETNYSSGMRTMDRSLKELYKKGFISYEVALERAKYPENFKNI